MKVYSIGREAGCNIVINDRTNVISRRHAVLNVMPSGKMTIVDQSSNGTYVNGIRISSNVPVPVTRKDNISFAHVARLDWNLIPNTRATIMWWIIGVLAAILLIVGGFFGYKAIKKPKAPVVPDTTIVTREQMEAELVKNREEFEKQFRDSLVKDSLRKDSIKKAEQKKQDSIRAIKQKQVKPTPKPTPKPVPKPKPEPKPEPAKPTRAR